VRPPWISMNIKLLSLSVCLVVATAGTVRAQTLLNPNPARVVGQPQLTLTTFNPNLVEGRELFDPQGIAVDTTVNPPILYVSDTGNNRVLAWKNATGFRSGQPADLVIGQSDKITTFRQGPGTTFPVGFSSPTGLAVDSTGNLYVVDSGNNRILRFPTPFSNSNLLPDLVIGQTNFNSGSANQGASANAAAIALSASGTVFASSLAFDSQGNLWFADTGNSRVLRYPASQLTSGNNGISADAVLGQLDFVSAVTPPSGSSGLLAKDRFSRPQGIAFDPSGNLFVTDADPALSRVLVFPAPVQSGELAARVMGVLVTSGTQQPSPSTVGQTVLRVPTSVFMIGNNPAVVDSYASRILVFPPYSQWPTETQTNPSPTATSVIGQFGDFTATPANSNNFTTSLNAGRPVPSASTFAFPSVAILVGSSLFVADSGNHRVVLWPQQGGQFTGASGVLGQDSFSSNAINLTEGREFDFVRPASPTGQTNTTVLDAAYPVDAKLSAYSGSFPADAGLVIDQSSNPPHLYVADPYNNRVLGFKDIRALKAGARADIVIGQPDMTASNCNYPYNNPDRPSASSLCRPAGVAVDSAGNLWVADSGNGRVLRFPTPFANPTALPAADTVLGQSNFTSKIAVATSSTMAYPYGIAFEGNNGLLVSDAAFNRVLYFPASNGAYTSGEAASKVFGQPDFNSTRTANSQTPEDNRMNGPHHIARDTDGRLYVADTGTSRVMIFGPTGAQPGADAHAVVILQGVARGPRGIYVSPQTGEIWVADTQGAHLVHYPNFDSLPVNNFASDLQITTPTNPLAVTADQYGDLFLADVGSRVTIYYPGVLAVNGASFLPTRALAPGVVASVCPIPSTNQVCQPSDPNQFGSQTLVFNQLPNPLPLPTVLADISVLVAGQPAPLYFVSPRQINFLMPSNAPTSGTVDLQVVQNSTGQVLGFNSQVPMNVSSPALFTQGSTGTGQVAALNQDGSVNSSSNPAPHGTVIQLFGTGPGAVSGAPPDGSPAQGQTSTASQPRVIIGTDFVPPDAIQYSGLAPGLVGVWQINVKIPDTVAPSNQVVVVVVYQSIPSNDPQRIRTTIAVK